jgi:hypothetical protein
MNDTVVLATVHTPAVPSKVTGNPEEAVAETSAWVPTVSELGSGVVKLTTCDCGAGGPVGCGVW